VRGSAEELILSPIPGDGPAEMRVRIAQKLELIIDPCSRALGHPIGLVGMGMIDRLEVREQEVVVTVLPTFPTCMFRGVIEEEIEKHLEAVVTGRRIVVRFAAAGRVWDESRLSPSARLSLGRLSKPTRDEPI
jgi:metal-sulfur cluster biosynthetic enzyme